MVLATNLGFPRIGDKRQLKKAVEAYWKGKSTKDELTAIGKDMRAHNWKLQKAAGLDHIPSNDFAYYDQVLNMTAALGLVPARYKHDGGVVDLDTYFAMARGAQTDSIDVTAMEMSKWYDTNYHYIVPEFEDGMEPKLCSDKIFKHYEEAKALGIETRPVLVGPATYVFLGKPQYDGFEHKAFVQKLIPVYNEILAGLAERGCQWVQIDEPVFSLDLCEIGQGVIKAAYDGLNAPQGLKTLVSTYFESLKDNAELAFGLPVDGIHIDLCRGSGRANTTSNDAGADIDQTLALIGEKVLSLGVVDGRNIWKNDLADSLTKVEKAVAKLGSDKVFVAGSCSLLHSPVDLNSETALDDELKGWMAFATQKLDEIANIAKGANDGREAITHALVASNTAQDSRNTSTRIHDKAV
jgi:5-methyltetrahydropteroyltriglutamate--homocysteine methyltransferase